MATVLEIKEYLKRFYSKYEAYLVPLLKFITAMTALLIINKELGFMTQLNSFAIVLIAALFCSFLPLNFIIVISALFTLGHVYKLSLECAAVVLVLFLLMFLLYFRFSPKDTIVVILTPICFALKIPTVMPLAMGLVGSPASVVSVGCGVIVYYVLSFIGVNASMINSLDADGSLSRFKYLIDGILGNKAMLVTVVAFAVTIILVYIIRRLPVDHCWTYAMIAGALMDVVILMLGDLKFRTNISILGTILGSIVAIGIVKILQLFVFNVDYSRTEHVQYEDDEYYYYVKAVPKMSVSMPDKTVTKIDTRKPVTRNVISSENAAARSAVRGTHPVGKSGMTAGSAVRSSATANRAAGSGSGAVRTGTAGNNSVRNGSQEQHGTTVRSASVAADRAAAGTRQHTVSGVDRLREQKNQ